MNLSIEAFAKINLFLEVCEKRNDGYHNIDSIMQSVSLCDIVSIKENESIILSNNKNLPNDKTNLCYKAAVEFFDYSKIKGGAEIHIEKNIPISAGLAGGSTDASAVLKGLNEIYKTNYSDEILCSIGNKIGADVPFCVVGGCKKTTGTGEILTPCPPLYNCYIVISKEGEGVSTPEAYGEIDKSRNGNTSYSSSKNIISALEKNDLNEISKYMYNIFETVVENKRPFVPKIKSIMNECGAIKSMMSGSGPSVFGIFDDKTTAELCISELKKNNIYGYLCRPI